MTGGVVSGVADGAEGTDAEKRYLGGIVGGLGG